MTQKAKRTMCVALLLPALLFYASCGSKSKEEKPAEKAVGNPKITADNAAFDFGIVKQGAEVTHVFKIKNTGKQNLLIDKARGS